MLYALQNFKHYLLGGHFKIFNDHSALKYLVNKPVLSGGIYKWLILFQEFDFEVIVKPGWLNVGPDHLSQIESGEEPTILEDNLLDAQLFAIDVVDKEFNAIIYLLNTGYAPEYYSIWQKRQLVLKASNYTLIAGKLYKLGPDEILRRCVFEHERQWVMAEAHAGVSGGHYARKETVCNILQAGL